VTNGFSRREFLAAGGLDALLPWNWFRRKIQIAGIEFRQLKRGADRRRYLHIHGNESTARLVLEIHMRRVDGRAFLVRSQTRNVPLAGGELDPNRMFSRIGAERNLRTLNPSWSAGQVMAALDLLDEDREKFLRRILPRHGDLLVALHNNGPNYSVQDEIGISDASALNDRDHPDEFMLCTARPDFERIAKGPYNALLQNQVPQTDDGSLSRLCAARGIRYVNIEAAHGNEDAQRRMLEWLETAVV
jgi:hypothetical protein